MYMHNINKLRLLVNIVIEQPYFFKGTILIPTSIQFTGYVNYILTV